MAILLLYSIYSCLPPTTIPYDLLVHILYWRVHLSKAQVLLSKSPPLLSRPLLRLLITQTSHHLINPAIVLRSAVQLDRAFDQTLATPSIHKCTLLILPWNRQPPPPPQRRLKSVGLGHVPESREIEYL